MTGIISGILSRRTAIKSGSALAASAALAPMTFGAAYAQSFSDDVLYKKDGLLEDKEMGDPNAKVKIVEYASLTCPHCATFHKTVFPALKEKYIDTGKVHFAFRHFTLNNLDAAASMLALCSPEENYFSALDSFLKDQSAWISRENTVGVLLNHAKQIGFTKETFQSCLSNQDLLDKLNKTKAYAGETLQVNATPTFFINGEKVSGGLNIDEFSKRIDALI